MARSSVAPWRIALALGIVYLAWGSTYLAIRVAVAFWPPLLIAGIRFFLAGALLLAWARAHGKPWPETPARWGTVALMGTLMLAGGNGGVSWAEQHVDSGLAAVLIATVSLWLILLEALRPGGDRPRLSALLGLALGLAGVAILVRPHVGQADDPHALAGRLVLLGASFLWSLGSILARRRPLPGSHAMSAALQMLSGGGVLLLLGLARGELARWPEGVAFWPLMALLYLIFFGSIAAFSAYQWLLRTTRPALVATYAYVNPVVAVLLGVLLLGEPLTAQILLGGTLVILSAFLIQRVHRRG